MRVLPVTEVIVRWIVFTRASIFESGPCSDFLKMRNEIEEQLRYN